MTPTLLYPLAPRELARSMSFTLQPRLCAAGLVRSVEAINHTRESAIEQLAARTRSEFLIPVCLKYGIRFVSGNGTYYLCSATSGDDLNIDGMFTSAEEAEEAGYDHADIFALLAMLDTPTDSVACIGHWVDDFNPSDIWLFVPNSNLATSVGVECFTAPGRWWVRSPGRGSHACVDFEPTPDEARAVLLLPERNTPDNDAPYTRSDLEAH